MSRQDLSFGVIQTPDGITSNWHWDPNDRGVVDDNTGKLHFWTCLSPEIFVQYARWLEQKGAGSFQAGRVR